jgi:C4-dicarboxylate-specific signal transduction histidine kinase
LPAETVVGFREPTAWEKYWREISVGIAVVVLEAVLIAALLLERRSRRRTAVALDESQKQMTLAAHAARLSWWIWDTARDKLRAAAQRGRGSETSGKRPTAFEEVLASAHPADRQELERAVEKALATGDEVDVEYRVVGSDGDIRWVAARGRAEKGGSKRLLGVALDVTERKAADLRAAQDRAALRHLTRVSVAGQLSAAIAHQLNQPLAAILGNAEAAQKMLARENTDLVELRAICNDIVSEDRRATDIIRRLSELFKRGDAKTEPIDLNGLIRETLDLLRTELLVRHVTPVMDLDPSLPVIEGGYVQLQQVVLNLVLNGADAMSAVDNDKRKLTIRTESTTADVRRRSQRQSSRSLHHLRKLTPCPRGTTVLPRRRSSSSYRRPPRRETRSSCRPQSASRRSIRTARCGSSTRCTRR